MAAFLARACAVLALIGTLTGVEPSRAENSEIERPSLAVDSERAAAQIEAEDALRAYQVGMWSFDVIVLGMSRPGLVLRFDPDGSCDGVDRAYVRDDGRLAETTPIHGTWTVTRIEEDRWRLEITVDGSARSSIFTKIDENRLLNERTGRIVNRVPQYADS